MIYYSYMVKCKYEHNISTVISALLLLYNVEATFPLLHLVHVVFPLHADVPLVSFVYQRMV